LSTGIALIGSIRAAYGPASKDRYNCLDEIPSLEKGDAIFPSRIRCHGTGTDKLGQSAAYNLMIDRSIGSPLGSSLEHKDRMADASNIFAT
jgi:hypothetical protein